MDENYYEHKRSINVNPYNQSSHPVEHKLYEYILAGNDSLRNHDIPWLDEPLLFNDDKCPRRDAPKEFVKKVLRFMHTDVFGGEYIEYSVSMYEYNIYQKFTESEAYAGKPFLVDVRFKFFIRDANNLLESFHRNYYVKSLGRYPTEADYRHDDEAIKRKLLEEAHIERKKPFGIIELAIYINDYLLDRIRTMTLNEMYDFYTRNLPAKMIKTKPKRRVKSPPTPNTPPSLYPSPRSTHKVLEPQTRRTPRSTAISTHEVLEPQTRRTPRSTPRSTASSTPRSTHKVLEPQTRRTPRSTPLSPFKEFVDKSHDVATINPWSSRVKANDFMTRNRWSDMMVENWQASKIADSFNYKQQAKSYMLRTAAPRHTYIIDYFDMAGSKISYMLAVNVNTRKAYAITPPSTRKQGDKWIQGRYGNKTAETAVKQLEELLRQTGGNVKHIISDQEAAFMSNMFKAYCAENGIKLNVYHINDLRGVVDTNESSRGVHGALGILDRLCRTIRRMHYNITGNTSSAITPPLMQAILDEYNRSPHTTLSKVLNMSISPNDVTDELEDILVQEALKHNLSVKMNSDFVIIGKTVMCYNEAGTFDKVRSKLLPGKWTVIGKDGGLYVVQRGMKTLKLPRYMLKVVEPY